jgi:metal-sulfur cluster biosynthetic enzyme
MTSTESIQDKIIETLKTVQDPELGINVYDLGLIYDILVDKDHNISITMTLTSPGCPVGELLVKQVKRNVAKLEETGEVEVDLVFEPLWDPMNLSYEVRLEMGLL